jgi:hypothetical protein
MEHIKLLTQLGRKQADDKQNANGNSIEPFIERPRTEPAVGQQNAHDLFSLFTADIIKEKTLFTR